MKYLTALAAFLTFISGTAIIPLIASKAKAFLNYWAENPTLYTKEFGELPLAIVFTIATMFFVEWYYKDKEKQIDSNE